MPRIAPRHRPAWFFRHLEHLRSADDPLPEGRRSPARSFVVCLLLCFRWRRIAAKPFLVLEMQLSSWPSTDSSMRPRRAFGEDYLLNNPVSDTVTKRDANDNNDFLFREWCLTTNYSRGVATSRLRPELRVR